MHSTFPALRSLLMYNKCFENLLVSYLNIMRTVTVTHSNERVEGPLDYPITDEEFEVAVNKLKANKSIIY